MSAEPGLLSYSPPPLACEERASALAAELGLLPETAALLLERGVTTREMARDFFRPSIDLFHDPFLLPDMDKAVCRVEEALTAGEKILVYGDYDVDGITSTALLVLYLRERGADPGYLIPDRQKEGYGISEDAVRGIADSGVRLLITVDNGVSAAREVALAASLGVDTVVTDHHTPTGQLPPALAVVNPMRADSRYPSSSPENSAVPVPPASLSGVGVALKLVCALEMRRSGLCLADAAERVMRAYGDLAAIGLLADVMPMFGENRYLVSRGLAIARENPRPGLRALLQTGERDGKDRPLTSTAVSFNLAPRLNAAGRLASAGVAVELFLTSSSSDARRIADSLNHLNDERRRLEGEIFDQAREMIEALPSGERVAVLAREGWHQGVIGVVAARLSERYRLPVILICLEGDTGKGSGRSIPPFSLVDSLASCSDLLLRFGGHALAAGFTLRRACLPEFTARIREMAREALPEGGEQPAVAADMLLSAKSLFSSPGSALRLAEELALLEPYGLGNRQPILVCENLTVREVVPLSGGKHTKLLVAPPPAGDDLDALLPPPTLPLLLWGRETDSCGILPGDCIDAAFSLEINEFAGTRTPQLIAKEIGYAGETRARISREEALTRHLIGGDPLPEGFSPTRDPLSLLPARRDFVEIYTYLRGITGGGEIIVCARNLTVLSARMTGGAPMPPTRARLALACFADAGILEVKLRQTYPETLSVKLCTLPARAKRDLEQTDTFRRARIALRSLAES